MASIGFLLAAAPSPDQALPSKVRRASSPPLLHPFSHSPAATMAALQHADTPHSFTYDRAIPSVRWPNLKLQELETSKTQFRETQFDPTVPERSDFDPAVAERSDIDPAMAERSDFEPAGDEGGGDSEFSERRSRRAAKKMNKLALKRAKDWRQRVQFLTDKILGLRPGEFVADVLDRRLVQMTPTDYCFVVKWVGASNWMRALEVYEWLNLRHWYSPNPRMLATILAVLGKANRESLAEEIFSRAESSAGNVVQVYNAMMGVYARSGRYNKVQELLSLMRDRCCEPDLISFNILINARSKSGNFPAGCALDLLGEVRNAGLRPDTVTYNTLISACSRVSNLDEAADVYADMERSSCQPDLWTYNAMISVYGRCGMAPEAERLFNELGQKGMFPDAVTYNALLYAFARDGNVVKVEEICKKMVKAGFMKDEMTYNTIIHMHGKQGRHDMALESYKDMKLRGCNPDSVTYTVLIDLLGKADRVSEAAKIMSEMVAAGVRPSLRAYSALICGYAKAGMRAEAEDTFSCMVRSGVKPDQLAYSVMLDILVRCNDTRKVKTIYREMIGDGYKPDQGLYQAMVKLFSVGQEDKEVNKFVKDMQVLCGISSKVITSILVKGECYSYAVDMMKLALSEGYDPDREDLISILNSYSSLGRQSEAHALLKFLKDNGSGLSEMVSDSLIVMYCDSDQLVAAMEEYSELKGAGVVGSCTMYETLIKCCEKNESFCEASQILSDMKFYAVEPSSGIYQSAVTINCKLGLPETGQYWLDLAERVGIGFSDQLVYVSLIMEYAKQKLLQKAESLVGRLRLQSKVDRKVWNALIDAYAMNGRYEQARAIFNMMLKSGPSPTVDSVNGLIQALIVDKRLDEIYVVLEELQDMGFRISKSSITLMLDAFAQDGNIFEMKKVYNGMKAAGYMPTMHLYKSMIKLLARKRKIRDVEILVIEMEEAGFKPDLIIFNSLLSMYTGINDFRKAVGVYNLLQNEGFKPNEDTYNILILMYCRDLRPEEGLALLHKMEQEGLYPKLDTYKSLIAACAKQQLAGRAEDLFQTLRARKYKLDRSFYHIMMKMYRDLGDHAKAQNVLLIMREAEVEPTIATMHMLMLSYGTAGEPQESEKLLNDLKSSKICLNMVVYTSVIDAYLKNGKYNLAIQKLREMKEDGVEPNCQVWACFIQAASLCEQTDEALLLLNVLREMGFDLPLRLLTEKTDTLVPVVDNLIQQLKSSEEDVAFKFVNALENLLWAFERRNTAAWVFQLAMTRKIYRFDVFRVSNMDWGADFRKLSAGAALVGLTLWLDSMQDASLQGTPESPKSVVLVTGTAEYNMVSLDKTIKAYLWEMGSPFLPCKTRTGVLVSKGHSLRMWLKDSPFCMDLQLRDAFSLPKSNSMRLNEGCFMRAGLIPAFKDIHDRLGHVAPKKFARLALLSNEKRQKVITADIEGRKQKLEKMKDNSGPLKRRKLLKLRKKKYIRKTSLMAGRNMQRR